MIMISSAATPLLEQHKSIDWNEEGWKEHRQTERKNESDTKIKRRERFWMGAIPKGIGIYSRIEEIIHTLRKEVKSLLRWT